MTYATDSLYAFRDDEYEAGTLSDDEVEEEEELDELDNEGLEDEDDSGDE